MKHCYPNRENGPDLSLAQLQFYRTLLLRNALVAKLSQEIREQTTIEHDLKQEVNDDERGKPAI